MDSSRRRRAGSFHAICMMRPSHLHRRFGRDAGAQPDLGADGRRERAARDAAVRDRVHRLPRHEPGGRSGASEHQARRPRPRLPGRAPKRDPGGDPAQRLGLALFLWFLASLWTTLSEAEGEASRGATAAARRRRRGLGSCWPAWRCSRPPGSRTSPDQADNVAALYTAPRSRRLGDRRLGDLLFGVAKVILQTGALGRWLGVLAFIAGLLAVCGFMTPFFEANVLNAATGALGRWAAARPSSSGSGWRVAR